MHKSYRIKKEIEFQKIINHKKSYANRCFVIYKLHNPHNKHFRVGISVSKRLGNAVIRNKIKRRIRHALIELKPKIKNDLDFIIIARKPTNIYDFTEILNNLRHAFKIADLLN